MPAGASEPSLGPTGLWDVQSREQASEAGLRLTSLLVLLAALRPFATLPPPSVAPPTWIHYPSSDRHVRLNTTEHNASLPGGEPAPCCCVAADQLQRATRLMQSTWEAATGTR